MVVSPLDGLTIISGSATRLLLTFITGHQNQHHRTLNVVITLTTFVPYVTVTLVITTTVITTLF